MTTNMRIIRGSVLLLSIMVLSLLAVQTGIAATTVSTTAGIQTLIPDQAVIIDGGVAVINDAGTITNGQVLIADGYVQGSDVLSWDSSLAASLGISGSFNAATGLLTFTGTASPADWQTLFRTVALTISSSITTTRTISFTIGNAIPLSENGHFYEFIDDNGISWTAADSAAGSKTLFGLQGYLATITSAAENAFVAGKLQGEGWMGASDAGSESVWRWMTGPEAGTQFFEQTGAASNSDNLAGVYSGISPGGGVAVGGGYSNWQSGEPNDYGTGEDYAHFRDDGTWNDYSESNGSIVGYVVEYGGMIGDPTVTLSAARVAAVRYTVTSSAGAGGSISPTGAQSVNAGETIDFTVTPAAATPSIVVGGTCPDGSWDAGGSQYTTGAITADCSLTFSFFSQMKAMDPDGDAFTGGQVASGTAVGFTLASPGTASVETVVTRGDVQTTLSAAGTAALLTTDDDGTYTFQAAHSGEYVITFTDSASGQEVTLTFSVNAQAAFSKLRQYGIVDDPVDVEIVLDDEPIAYPVVIPYTVQGAALSGDLEATGSVTIHSPDRSARISFTPDAASGEVLFALSETGMSNAVLGGLEEHTVVLQEAAQVMPKFELATQQGLTSDTLVTASGGPVSLSAIPPDGGSYSYDWSDSDLDLGIYGENSGTVTVDPTLLDGRYHVRVTITEDASPYRQVTLESELRVADAVPAIYSDYYGVDYQNDPQRLPICPESTAVPGCTAGAVSEYLEAPEGYTLTLGGFSGQASWARNDYGLAVDTTDIVDDSGQQTANADDSTYTHLGFCVDYELRGLDRPGDSIPLVVPLPDGVSIPAHAVWRKYTSRQGWQNFQSDAGNTLYSAPRNDAGNCPGPLSAGWSEGLNLGDTCVRLTLQDGGPDDQDGQADGVIRDPGTLAVPAATDSGGGGAFGWLPLSVLVGLALRRWKIFPRTRG
jgi:hypothetical protein